MPRSAQDPGDQEVAMLLKRINQIETQLERARGARGHTPRIRAAHRRLEGISVDVDDLGIED